MKLNDYNAVLRKQNWVITNPEGNMAQSYFLSVWEDMKQFPHIQREARAFNDLEDIGECSWHIFVGTIFKSAKDGKTKSSKPSIIENIKLLINHYPKTLAYAKNNKV